MLLHLIYFWEAKYTAGRFYKMQMSYLEFFNFIESLFLWLVDHVEFTELE